jgi:hypothetical protein
MCFWVTVSARRVRAVLLGVGAVTMIIAGYFTWTVGYYAWQADHQYAAALWLRDNTPPGTRIGSMNSGIIGYYSERPTTNLDGVVNPQAFEAIQDSRLFAFIQSLGIKYLVDTDYALEREYGVFMGSGYPDGLQAVAVLPVEYPPLGFMRVYEVQR